MTRDRIRAPELDHFVVALGILGTLLVTAVAAGLSGATRWPDLGWVFAQSAILIFPLILVTLATKGWARRSAALVSVLVSLGLPALMLVDRFTHGWIGERFLSAAAWRIVTELSATLLQEAATGMIRGIALLVVAIGAGVPITFWAARQISKRWRRSARIPGPGVVLFGAMTTAGILAVTSLRNENATKQAMLDSSTRHPFCILGLVSPQSATDVAPVVFKETDEPAGRRAAIEGRDHAHRRLALRVDDVPGGPLPDVVIVVVESFRPELVHPDVMPNLWRLAEAGIYCRHHFSGGNATNHGMFTLVNGLDAIWHERPVRYSPLMNRLMMSAGYEIGFFASHDQWRDFYMDGYISEEHYDEFFTAPPSGILGDRKATERALAFLHRGPDAGGERQPKLALLYLYATHAIYDSYAEDRVFLPQADDRMLYPYTEASREGVWNRYRNSARSVDRLIRAVIDDDRIVIVTGDHGEAFLEDGTIGHGIRLSKVQNRTPAIISIPDVESRTIDAPSHHVDLLPTLLSALGLETTDPAVFDGLDLLAATSSELSTRVFSTRNYLHDDMALIGPWTQRSDQPFALRVSVSIRDGTAVPLNAIDDAGNAHPTQMDLHQVTSRWFADRLGIPDDALSGPSSKK